MLTQYNNKGPKIKNKNQKALPSYSCLIEKLPDVVDDGHFGLFRSVNLFLREVLFRHTYISVGLKLSPGILGRPSYFLLLSLSHLCLGVEVFNIPPAATLNQLNHQRVLADRA